MRSERRIFEEIGISARGHVLPFDEFKLCRDVESREIQGEFGDYIVSQAEPMLTEEIPLLPLSLYRDFFLTGVRSRFEKVHHNRRRMLFYMTLAEAYENKGRFVEKIADLLWAILEESSWVIPAHFSHSRVDSKTTVPEIIYESQIPGLDLYAANCCATVALCVYLVGEKLDTISPVICEKAKQLIYRRGIRPFLEASYSWSGEGGAKCNNWVTNITSNILFASALTSGDLTERESVVERAMRYLDNYTASSSADGACDEGPGYWSGAAGNLFDCIEIIDDMTGGEITAYSDPLVRRMGEYIAEANITGNYFLNFSDARPVLMQPGKMIMRYGRKCGSERLYRFGAATALSNPVSVYYFFGMPYRVYKDALTKRPTEAQPVPGKEAVWYPDTRIAIFRDGTDTGRGFYLAVKGGHNKESHNHKDVGCIVIYHNGKPVIVDPSHGSYDNGFFGPTRYLRWYMKSTYHSIPTPCGIEQGAGSEAFCSSDEVFSESEKSISLDLAGAFPCEAGVISMKRECSLRDGRIRICDSVTLKEEGEVSFNYLSYAEPKLREDGSLELSDNRIFDYTDRSMTLRVERVENKNLPYEDLNFRSIWGTDALYLISLVARGKDLRAEVIIR